MDKTKVPMKEEEPEESIKQIMSDRQVSIDKTSETVECWTIELEYKEDQMDNEILEENVSTLYNIVSHPKDHKKPRHVMKIEIGMLKRNIKKKKEELKVMKELQLEDKEKLEKGKNASKSN